MRTINRIILKIRRTNKEIVTILSTIIAKGTFFANDIRYGANLCVKGKLYIDNAGTVVIGNNVTINSAGWANPIGGGNKTEFQIRGGITNRR